MAGKGTRARDSLRLEPMICFYSYLTFFFSTNKLFKTIERTTGTTVTMNVHLNAPPHLESSTRQATMITQSGHVTTCFEPHIAHRHLRPG